MTFPGIPHKRGTIESDIADLRADVESLKRALTGLGGVSIGVGGFMVSDSSGVERFRAGGDGGVVVRDATGTVILDNSNTSGWGLSSPALPVPMYPVWWSGQPYSDTTTGTGWRQIWFARAVVTHPRLEFSVYSEYGASSTGRWRIAWATDDTTQSGVPYTSPSRTAAGFYDNGISFVFPQTMQNQVVNLYLEAQLQSGSGYVAVIPQGVMFTGD